MATTTPDAPSTPEEFADNAEPFLCQIAAQPGEHVAAAAAAPQWTWTPMWRQACGFGPGAFDAVMQNLLRNPNQLSSWLFRADVLHTGPGGCLAAAAPAPAPCFAGLALAGDRTLVRRLVPRNTLRDQPMLQTCLFYESAEAEEGRDDDADEDEDEAAHDRRDDGGGCRRSLVVYLPHAAAPADVPFYHPKVRGVGFLHEWRADAAEAVLSIHFAFFAETGTAAAADPASRLGRPVLARVALNLLQTVRKHGEGRRRGYVKRVHHDQLVPQARVQDRYTRLKERHARRLVQAWQETTDPAKHVFEDLAIAAFLIELWADMYGGGGGGGDQSTTPPDGVPAAFPGFVDVGCGNGLLVHVLHAEGYRGWGFDARRRRSWRLYGDSGSDGDAATDSAVSMDTPLLQERVLLPFFLAGNDEGEQEDGAAAAGVRRHDGRFPPGTFVIANHADELTAWTPVLAALAGCPFLAIPCCSHNFTGARFRAAAPAAPAAATAAASCVSVDLASSSTYASFVAWATGVAEACGWAVELEMLRIPSTRNAGLVGRRRRRPAADGDDGYPALTVEAALAIVAAHGGAHGFADNVAKLAAKSEKQHADA